VLQRTILSIDEQLLWQPGAKFVRVVRGNAEMSLAKTCERPLAQAVLAALLVLTGLQDARAQDLLARAAASSLNLAAARTAFEGWPESDRQAIQDALIWTGHYNGVADGAFGRQTFDAITAYQQSQRKPPSGILNPAERAELQTATQRARSAVGFVVLDDPRTGARLGLPTIYLSKNDANATGGSRWQSADGKVTLDTRTAPQDVSLQSLYDRNLAIQAAGRVVTYKILRPTFLVIAGETASGKFYTRYDSGPLGIRGFSMGYDKSVAAQVDRLVVAIANSFDPFGSSRVAAPVASGPPRPAAMPSPAAGREMIGTGVAIGPRRVLTTAPLAACGELRVGDISTLAPNVEAALWSIVELPQDLPGAFPLVSAATAKPGEAVFVLAYSAETGRSLAVVPATVVDAAAVSAPLQQGASGALVVDGSNHLLGIIGPVSGDGRKIAGIMTTARHQLIGVGALSGSIPLLSETLPDERHLSAAAIAALWKSALVPLTCGTLKAAPNK
jgi:peptidoglycan hydrolase-like protein with peptidoglycan-binding domain